ncbi:peptidylprolyl isomerase [Geodermatophilus obscurus]|nr:peptidylprolyl isomerase [Geodermatophilus obscurus]
MSHLRPRPTALSRRPAAVLPAVLTAAVLLTTACTSGGDAAGSAGPAAVVDGRPVEQAELDRRLATVTSDPDVSAAIATDAAVENRLRADVLAQLIEVRVVSAAAPDLGAEVTDEELDAHVDRLAEEQLGGGPDAWAAFLAERGYPEEEVRAQLGEDLLREEVEDLLGAPAVAPEQVAQAHAAEWQGRKRVAHVLVASPEEAAAALAELRAGADFATLARERSLDQASAASGGDLGPWIEDQYVAAFDQAVENATGPGLLEPVSTPFGWHVIEVRAPATLEEVSGLITEQLAEQQQDAAYAEWVAGVRAGVDVDVRDDLGDWDRAGGTVTP